MKTKIVSLLFIIGLFTLTACSIEDEEQSTSADIGGSWNLIQVFGSANDPINIQYQNGEVIWDFDTATSMVTVTNTIITTGPEDIHAGLETGTYTFGFIQGQGTENLIIDSQDMGEFSINAGTFSIDTGFSSDGYIKTFNR